MTPQEMSSWMTWQEITSSYAGLFFRAFGGNSSSFGSTKEANAPRLTEVRSEHFMSHSGDGRDYTSGFIKEGDWSKWVWSGAQVVGGYVGNTIDMRFYSSGGEIRPRNTAVKIWKRNA